MNSINWQGLADAGAEAAVAFVNGNSTLMNQYQADYLSDSPEANTASAFVLEHAAYALAGMLEQLSASGRCSFNPPMPTVAALHYMKAAHPGELLGVNGLLTLCAAYDGLKGVSLAARANLSKPSAAKPVDNAVQKFEIVGMPTRLTDVTVERDAESFEITKTTHRERDA